MAVFEDLTGTASDQFDYMLSWDTFLDENVWAKNWGNNGPSTFILLRADANPALVTKKITHFLDNYNKEQSKSFRIELGMQRFEDVYLHSNFKNGVIEGGRIEYIRQFVSEAILLSFFSMILALAMLVLVLPTFNHLTGKHIVFPFGNSSF